MWTTRLRLVLRLNATSSLLFGLLGATSAGWVSDTLGVDHAVIVRAVGIGLVGFAAWVFVVAGRSEPALLAETRLVSAGDAAWVAATVVVLAAQVLSTIGVVAAVIIGVAVADFGITQMWMRSKAQAEGPGQSSASTPNSAGIVAGGAPSS